MPTHASKKKQSSKENLPLIKCFCGATILLIPNIKQMSEAIEAHVLEHTKEIEAPEEAEVEAERVRDDLTAKVLSKACEA